jgi:hypothetical protein
MYAIQSLCRYWSRQIPLTRSDFFLSPGWNGELQSETLEGILDSLMGVRTRAFVWNVRFDHEPLANGLVALGFIPTRVSTRVVPLSDDYDRVFASCNATTRNHVRKAARRGLHVRTANHQVDIIEYERVYKKVAEEKGWRVLYPIELSRQLMNLSGSTCFLVAEYDNRIVGGGLFVRDGSSVVYYLHGVQDRDYADLFPLCAVIAEGIRWACESRATMFNLGMSGGIESLDKFKASWGAYSAFNWTFAWANPRWQRMSALKEAVKRGVDALRLN